MSAIDLQVGLKKWEIELPPEKEIRARFENQLPPSNMNARELIREALEKPFGFEPMRRALTPDDRVAIVFDPNLPHATELLSGVLDHLKTASIDLATVTVILPPNARQDWIDQLPTEFEEITVETHLPSEPKKLAYLSTTKSEKRIYLNRTFVESDFAIILSARGYDPIGGYSGAERAIYPDLSDEAARLDLASSLSFESPGSEAHAASAGDAREIAWLLGTPFLVQVILGNRDEIQEVVAGLLDSSSEGVRRLNARWWGKVSEQPKTVIACLSGASERMTFLDLAKAAACAARVVDEGGRIAIVCDAAPELLEGMEKLRSLESPKGAFKTLAKLKPSDWSAAYLWAFAAKRANLFLASQYPDEITETLFATSFHRPSELQRLVDAAESVLVIQDAHRTMITLE